MKKYIAKIFIFFVIMVSLDVVVGVLSDYLVTNAKSGATQKSEYICEKTKEDILIFGSSRAVHHYNPLIIQDSLNMTCYNCGYDACGMGSPCKPEYWIKNHAREALAWCKYWGVKYLHLPLE